MTRRAYLLFALACACVVSACLADLPGGYYGCRDGKCPPGQACDARDQRCYIPRDESAAGSSGRDR